MKGTLIILAVSAIAGAGLALSGIGHQITLLLSPLTTIVSGLFQQAQTLYTQLSSLPFFTPVAGILVTAGGSYLTYKISSYFTQRKLNQQHAVEMAKLQTDAYATIGTVQQQLGEKDTQIKALTEKLSGVPDPSALLTKVESQKTEIQQLIAEKAEAMRILTAIRTPNINDQINLLEQAGYQVRKLIP